MNDFRDMLGSKMSTGMKQKVSIARTIVHDPPVLIFDEPTSGLDPVAHIEIRNLIESLRDQGKTIFLSSHQLSDVELVCDRITIMNFGKLVKAGRVEDLVAEGRTQVTASGVPAEIAQQLEKLATNVESTGDRLVATIPDEVGVNDIVDLIRNGKGSIVSVIPLKRTLEEIFVETVGLAGPHRRIGTMNQMTRDSQK
jgi:ABC-2 type transport system ATP-binding protein